MRPEILKRYNRDKLQYQEFFEKVVPFGQLIQRFTQEKCWQQGLQTELGLCSSIATADIILKSSWGTHDVARKANNLCLLEKHTYWKGKGEEYGGKSYRSYASWLDFVVDYTDELTNIFETVKYSKVLAAPNLDRQMELFSSLQEEPTTYHGRIEWIIEHYGLWEFDN